MVTKTDWRAGAAEIIQPGRALAAVAAPVRLERHREPSPADHIALAAQLGLEPNLGLYLAASGCQPLDYDAVCRHIEALATAAGARWFWSPLRPKDGECRHMDGYRGDDGQRHGYTWLGRRYAHTVPLHVLQRVRQIESEFAGRAYFFVSDYAAPDPDPYLMVTDGHGTPFVTDRWAEPAWRAAPLREAQGIARRSKPARWQEPRRGKPFAAVLAYVTIMGMLLATAGWCIVHMARAYGISS